MAKPKTKYLERQRPVKQAKDKKILKAIVWSTLMYQAEGWSLRNADRQKIEAAEMWFYKRLLSISWKEKRKNDSIIKQLGVNGELYAAVVRRCVSLNTQQIDVL